MQLPFFCQIAVSQGIAKTDDYAIQTVIPAGGTVTLSMAPVDGLAWAVYNVVWGNLTIGQLTITEEHTGSMITHTNIDYASKTDWPNPAWMYVTDDNPYVVTLTNPGLIAQTIDWALFMVQMPETSLSKFKELLYGAYNFLLCYARGPCPWELLQALIDGWSKQPPSFPEVPTPQPIETDAG